MGLSSFIPNDDKDDVDDENDFFPYLEDAN